MASECFVSRASIQRFARGIGLESFTDLKRSVASDTTGIEEALSSATERDLIVTVSTTGIFALAIAGSMLARRSSTHAA